MPVADVDVPPRLARAADGTAVNVAVVQDDHIARVDVDIDSFGQVHVAPAIDNELPSNLRVIVASWLGWQRALRLHALRHR